MIAPAKHVWRGHHQYCLYLCCCVGFAVSQRAPAGTCKGLHHPCQFQGHCLSVDGCAASNVFACDAHHRFWVRDTVVCDGLKETHHPLRGLLQTCEENHHHNLAEPRSVDAGVCCDAAAAHGRKHRNSHHRGQLCQEHQQPASKPDHHRHNGIVTHCPLPVDGTGGAVAVGEHRCSSHLRIRVALPPRLARGRGRAWFLSRRGHRETLGWSSADGAHGQFWPVLERWEAVLEHDALCRVSAIDGGHRRD